MHKAIIAKIDKVIPIQNADRIQTAIVLGQQVVVSKEWEVGMVGVYFQPELQLSEEFCSYNNLFRDSEKNRDKNTKGFFDNNRRVRCQPFLKVKSEGFFCETSSLVFCGENHYLDLQVGDALDELNGYPICKKYISEKTARAMANIAKSGKKVKPIETPMFHKHSDTDQFAYYVDKIEANSLLSFHAKVHGTSARMSYSKVIRTPSTWKDKFLSAIGLFKAEAWEYLVGTRNVVLYEHETNKEGFHGSEQFRFDVMEMVKPHLEKGMTIYGEIAGYANGSPVMGKHSPDILKDKAFKKKYGDEIVYKYGCHEGQLRFHVYRICYVNESGLQLDFTDAQVAKWCENRGLNAPLSIHKPFIYSGTPEAKEELIKLVAELTERPDVMTEDFIDPSHPSEGIIIRVDGSSQVPKFYKSKSYVFKCLEGIFKENNVDLEDAS